jgi:hypothetical protein
MISKKINQSLKIGIFILIAIGSFLIFPKLVKAWCIPSCYSGVPCGSNIDAYVECQGGVTPGCCACAWQYNVHCDDVGYLCKSGTCFTASSGAWTKCNKFPDTGDYNGQPCGALQSNILLSCEFNGQGVWDASERKCVKCNGKLENKVCGSAGTVSTDTCNGTLSYCISLGCAVEGNKKCESACDPSNSSLKKCDDKTPGTPGNPGDPCGNGGHCDENCQCVGEIVPPQCSDGIDNDGDGKIDFPADPGCTDASDNDETDVAPPGACNSGPTYTCPAGITCPGGVCSEELRGGLVPCGRMCDDPCTAECECAPCTLCHLFVLFKRIVDFLTLYILFPLAVLMIVVGGVMFLIAAGDPEKIRTAKKILTSVVIGLVIIFLAWLIVDTIIMFITKSGSPFRNWSTINCPLPEEAAGSCTSDTDCSSPTPFCRNGKCTIMGDVNGDCVVNNTDRDLCTAHLNENWPPCDWDKNGIVDVGDLATVGANIGNTCP